MEFNFNENLTVPKERWEAVPDDFKGLYSEAEDGSYKLGSEHPGVQSAIKAVAGLQRALVASRGEAKQAKGKFVDLGALSDYGSTVEEIAEGVRGALNVASKGKSEDIARQVEKIKADLGVSHAEAIRQATEERDGYRNMLKSVVVDKEAISALNEAGIIDADLALPMLKNVVGVLEENGAFNVRILDAAGDPRYSGTSGAPMTIKDYVTEMKSTEKYAPLFKSEQKAGGGALPASGRAKAGGQELSPVGKISAGLPKR